MNKKVPQSLSAIDPNAIGHSRTSSSLQYLQEQLSVTCPEDQDEVELQVRKLQTDTRLPPYKDMRVDEWWGKVAALKKYDELCKVVFAALSIFHGPQVESSFNTMGDVIDIRSCQMKTETYSAFQTVKYYLKARDTKAVSYFKRPDILHSAVDRKLCVNLKTAAAEYKADNQRKKRVIEDRQARLKLKSNLLSKAEMKRQVAKAEKMARRRHKVNMIKRQPAQSSSKSRSTKDKAQVSPQPMQSSEKSVLSSTSSVTQVFVPSSDPQTVPETSPVTSAKLCAQKKRKLRLQTLEDLVKKKQKRLA